MSLKRDPRSFIAVHWTLVEGGLGANLARDARARLGFVPALGYNAIGGIHFRTETGRAVVFIHPAEPHGSLVAMARSLIAAKHSASQVECLGEEAVPSSVRTARRKLAPQPSVSFWPGEHPSAEQLPVVIEYTTGGYLHRCLLKTIFGWSAPACDLDEAATFHDAEEARDWLDTRGIHEPIVLRYLVAARAEQDGRDAALTP